MWMEMGDCGARVSLVENKGFSWGRGKRILRLRLRMTRGTGETDSSAWNASE